jgi:urease accessory protein
MPYNINYSSACIAALVALSALASPQAVLAHTAHGDQGALLSGILHPFSGADHVLAMVAVGIWSAQLGSPAVRYLPFVFPLIMALGGLASVAGLPLPGVEVGIALSAVVLGTLILFKCPAPVQISVLIVAIFALFHGYSHVAERVPGHNALVFGFGFVMSTGFLHATGIFSAFLSRWTWGPLALRGTGVGILAGGMTFLWGAVA